MDEPRKQVLCVDDEPEIIYRIKRFIERRYPIDVHTATNGHTALKMMSERPYDAVLTDVSMPGMNGLDLTAEIIRRYPATIVIIITGSGDYELMARSKGARFLIKPVSLEEIKHLILQCFGMIPV